MVVETAINQSMTMHVATPGPTRGRPTNNAAANRQTMTMLMNQKINIKLAEVNDTAR